jgi:hypothetical protein
MTTDVRTYFKIIHLQRAVSLAVDAGKALSTAILHLLITFHAIIKNYFDFYLDMSRIMLTHTVFSELRK